MAEVLGIVSIILGLTFAWPCLVIWFALAFPGPVDQARGRLQRQPWACAGTGAALAITLGVLAFVLINHPHGVVKLLGWALTSALLLLGTLGAAGMVRLIAARLRPESENLSSLGALVRAAVLTEFAALFPVLGWFLFAPAALLANLGAGTLALAARDPRVAGRVPSVPNLEPPAAPFWLPETERSIGETATHESPALAAVGSRETEYASRGPVGAPDPTVAE